MSGGVWISESAEDQPNGAPGSLPMVEAIAKLRDEATVVLMRRHRGSNRALSLVLAKLDEARLWATDYDVSTGSRSIVNRAKILQSVAAATDTTDTTGNGRDTADV